jgi:hypothetical protein
MRVAALILATASGIIVVGSFLWAWAADDFWESVPLYLV